MYDKNALQWDASRQLVDLIPACTAQGVYPSMHCAGGVCIPACTGQGGVCPGVCLGGVCPGGCLPGGGVCLGGGVSAWGVCVCPGGCLPEGVCIQACNGADMPPVNRQTPVKT